MERQKPVFRITAREKPEWDAAALAQLVLALARARAAKRRDGTGECSHHPVHPPEEAA